MTGRGGGGPPRGRAGPARGRARGAPGGGGRAPGGGGRAPRRPGEGQPPQGQPPQGQPPQGQPPQGQPPQGQPPQGQPPQGQPPQGQPPQGAWGRTGPAQPPQGAWGRTGPAQPPQQAPRPQSAWGKTQTAPAQAGPSRGPSQPPRAGPSGGDPTQRVSEQMGQMSVSDTPGGDAARSLGRGSMRGNRQIAEVVLRTKPPEISSKTGTTGDQVKFMANYFRFSTKTDWCLYQYRVDFSPEEDRTVARRALLRVHKPKLGGYIFDGTVMFISKRLHPEDNVIPVLFTSKRLSDDAIINIHCRLVGDVMLGNPQYIQFFNLMFRSFMGGLELQMVKRDFYDAKNKIIVDKVNMELWPGYQTSIRQHENEILLNAEITHKVMRQETCLDLLKSCAKSGGDFRTLFVRAVVGTVVLTDYNNRTYRVDDVNWGINPSATFRKGDKDVTYLDYMKERYKITIQDPRQPMLVSKSKPRELRAGQSETVYLIPEVCRCTGLTEDLRTNPRVMNELAHYTRLTPANRITALISFINRLISEPKVRDQMNLWQMRIADQPITIPGRILPKEDIVLGNGKKEKASADWIRGVRASPYVYTVPMQNWAVVYPNRIEQDVAAFCDELTQCGRGMKFNWAAPLTLGMRDDSAASYVATLNKLFDRERPQIVLCIVNGNRSDRYNAIKKICYIDRGVPSQVVTTRIARKGMSVSTKVTIQMACKIGCIPWTVVNYATGLMVVGFDVCHDATRKEFSYEAMVATTNDTFGSYYSCVSKHEQGQELSNTLATNILKAVREWAKQNNGSKPARIVVYRDGVGDGDIGYVYEHEVSLVKKMLDELYGTKEPVKFTFIIVNKRIKTRYFLNNNNPPPGSVVDDVITQPERYDFYLVSQYVGQGSVSPTAYNVICDSSKWTADIMQRLTYKLTHMYYNWPGPIRVPAPCQYAHKLAFLVGQTLHRETSPELETTLYYL